jgi:hypothetical protein
VVEMNREIGSLKTMFRGSLQENAVQFKHSRKEI